MERVIGAGIWLAWATLTAVWVVKAAQVKRKARGTSTALRLAQQVMMAFGYGLVSGLGHAGALNRTMWNPSWAIAWVGLAVTWAGASYAIWARFTLGRNWSAKPMVKEEHELIVRGPYALTRHPIYTGLLLAASGTGMAVDELRSALGVAVLLAAILVKITQEERLMTETFPAQYPAYRKRVRALVPWVI